MLNAKCQIENLKVLKLQLFPSGVGGNNHNRANRRVKFGLKFIWQMEYKLRMNYNVALCLPGIFMSFSIHKFSLEGLMAFSLNVEDQ